MSAYTAWLRRPWVLLAGLWLILCLFNVRRLTDPPYWDAVFGVYSQSVWLARNDFDYITLFHSPHFAHGGPNIEFFSLMAALYAALIRLLPPETTFLFLHLLILFCAAWTIYLAYRLIEPDVPPVLAIAWIASSAFNPIWTGQIASLYLEVPLAAAIMTSIYALRKKRYGAAAGFGLLAFFIKSSGLLYALACFVYGVIRLGLSRRNKPQRAARERQDRRLLWLLVPFPVVFLLSLLNTTNLHGVSDVLGYFVYFVMKSPLHFPAMALELAALVILLVLHAWNRWARPQTAYAGRGFPLFFLSVFVLGFWAAYVTNTSPLPRYTVMVLFPMTCLLAVLTAHRRALALGIALPVLVFHLFNQQGQLLPPIPYSRGPRNGAELERSREYLKDLDATRSICRLLAERYGRSPLVTKWPFTHMVRVPEFGYVETPLPFVVEAAQPAAICRTYSLAWFLRRPGSHRSLCLYSPNPNEFHWGVSLKPGPEDRVLWEEDSLPGTVVLFERDWDRHAR